MHAAPDDEVEACAMPKATKQHGDDKVEELTNLAFAVAAHLDSDILIADEVLAVGDASFQKKAIGKMSSLSTSQGRTVLFVSHNMAAVKSLCNKGVILEKGKLKFQSNSIDEAIEEYQNSGLSINTQYEWVNNNEIQSDFFTPNRMYIINTENKKTQAKFYRKKIHILPKFLRNYIKFLFRIRLNLRLR